MRPAAEATQVAAIDETHGASGDASTLYAGDWSSLIIGTWSGLDILVDPYTHGTTGEVRLVVLHDCDVAVRHPESFAAIQDAVV